VHGGAVPVTCPIRLWHAGGERDAGQRPARPLGLAVNQPGCPSWIPEENLAQKADAAMYENDPDGRFEAALRLAENDPARGAEALRDIVADDAFDPDTRSEAAHLSQRLRI
jgi:hypothetical protein